MGQILPAITPQQASFIRAQPLYFVASAPRADDGHINLSPKGPEGVLDYQRRKNALSIDGQPAPGIDTGEQP
nr:hypothetical protein [Thioalkalivibrio sulfidiphilus]